MDCLEPKGQLLTLKNRVAHTALTALSDAADANDAGQNLRWLGKYGTLEPRPGGDETSVA